MVASGTKVLPFPKAVMDAAFKITMSIYADLSAKNPAWKKIYADYADFQREENLWFRFTEAQFDNFMHAQKL